MYFLLLLICYHHSAERDAGESELTSSNFSIDTLEDLLKHKKRHKELIYGRYGVVTSPEYDPVRRTYVLLARDCRSETRELVREIDMKP